MSADNVIYVLKLQDQTRVLYMGAPDNLYWSHKTGSCSTLVPSRLFEYFKEAEVFLDKEKASDYAFKLYEKEGYVEYGVQVLEVNKSWLKVLKEARDYIAEEKLFILSSDNTKMSDKAKEEVLSELNYLYADVLNQLVKRKQNKTKTEN